MRLKVGHHVEIIAEIEEVAFVAVGVDGGEVGQRVVVNHVRQLVGEQHQGQLIHPRVGGIIGAFHFQAIVILDPFHHVVLGPVNHLVARKGNLDLNRFFGERAGNQGQRQHHCQQDCKGLFHDISSSIYSPPAFAGMDLCHPFTEPIITPLAKYFSRNG